MTKTIKAEYLPGGAKREELLNTRVGMVRLIKVIQLLGLTIGPK